MLPYAENFMKAQAGNYLRCISSLIIPADPCFGQNMAAVFNKCPDPFGGLPGDHNGPWNDHQLVLRQFLLLKMLTVDEINRYILIGKCPEVACQ